MPKPLWPDQPGYAPDVPGFAPALPPGTVELAQAVAQAARTSPAVWMAGHGLCSTGASLAEALCLTEELEHLAAIQLLSMS